MPLVKMRLFTLCAALRICQLLRGEQLQTRVKWPNDLLVDGKKLGGMLTEARVDTDIMRDLIFGLGLNLNSRASDLPEALRATATSAADHLGTLPSINRLGASILKTVLDVYEECQESELGERLVKDWSEMDGIRGERITARAGREKIEGIAAGITPDGALVIETTEGRQHFILSGDATLSPEQ
jgi:BirA family biotin operon repressor/biotin-[acetyl-CoA-carboxylase] ligase